jgi:hypothetical protein
VPAHGDTSRKDRGYVRGLYGRGSFPDPKEAGKAGDVAGASAYADITAMLTTIRTKATRNSVVSAGENPWEAVAGVLEELDEGQRAVLVVEVGGADIPHRTKHRRRRCESASE